MDSSKFEGDRIVISCLRAVDVPLTCRDRKEMFGACLNAGGPCAYGIGAWKDEYIRGMLRYIDSVDWLHDLTMLFGLYPGSEECMEHVWPASDIAQCHTLAAFLQKHPEMRVVSRQVPGEYPHLLPCSL